MKKENYIYNILWTKYLLGKIERKYERIDRLKKWGKRTALALIIGATSLIPFNNAFNRAFPEREIRRESGLSEISALEEDSVTIGTLEESYDSDFDEESFQEYMQKKYGVSEAELNSY